MPSCLIFKLHEPNTKHRDGIIHAPSNRFFCTVCNKHNIASFRRRSTNYSVNCTTINHRTPITKELSFPFLQDNFCNTCDLREETCVSRSNNFASIFFSTNDTNEPCSQRKTFICTSENYITCPRHNSRYLIPRWL